MSEKEKQEKLKEQDEIAICHCGDEYDTHDFMGERKYQCGLCELDQHCKEILAGTRPNPFH